MRFEQALSLAAAPPTRFAPKESAGSRDPASAGGPHRARCTPRRSGHRRRDCRARRPAPPTPRIGRGNEGQAKARAATGWPEAPRRSRPAIHAFVQCVSIRSEAYDPGRYLSAASRRQFLGSHGTGHRPSTGRTRGPPARTSIAGSRRSSRRWRATRCAGRNRTRRSTPDPPLRLSDWVMLGFRRCELGTQECQQLLQAVERMPLSSGLGFLEAEAPGHLPLRHAAHGQAAQNERSL